MFILVTIGTHSCKSHMLFLDSPSLYLLIYLLNGSRVQTLVDPITKAPLPPPSASQPKVGQHLLMTVHIPPTMSETSKYQKTEEIITHVDHEEFRVAWKYATLPKWLLGAERWQCLSSLPSPDGGKETTKYETREVFSGPLAYIVKWFMWKGLEEAFAVMGDALKVRSETQAQEQGS